MISMNITSPSSPLEQTNFILEDWGTNLIDSSIKFSFRTYSVAMEANGSGCGCGLELVFPRLPSPSCPSSGLLTWDPLGYLGWIMMALIELWTLMAINTVSILLVISPCCYFKLASNLDNLASSDAMKLDTNPSRLD
ncbi:hypothetical protein Tco_0980489 [Tanacetum coccineum]